MTVGADQVHLDAATRAVRERAEMLDADTHALIATDVGGIIVYWGRGAERLYGWSADEVLGCSVVDVMTGEGTRIDAEAILAQLSAGQSWTGAFPVRRRDGETFEAYVTDVPVHDHGQLVGIIGMSTPVPGLADTARYSGARRPSDDHLAFVLDAIRVGVWDWNILSGQLRWSPSLEPLHGVAPGSFDGRLETFLSSIEPTDRERVTAEIYEVLPGGSEFQTEFRIRRPDGAIRWIAGRGRVIRDDAGSPMRMVGLGMDITEQRTAEAALRQEAARNAARADLARALTESELDTAAGLAAVARSVATALGDAAFVQLVSADGRPLEPAGLYDADSAMLAVWREMVSRDAGAIVEGIAGHVLGTGKPARLAADDADAPLDLARLRRRLDLPRLDLRGMLIAPLQAGERPIGVIGVARRPTGEPFTADDEAFLRELADRAGLAIENMRLNRDVRESEALYRAVVEQSADAIVIVEGVIAVYANTAYRVLLGVDDPSEIIGRSGAQWVHPDDRRVVVERALARQRGEPAPTVFEYRIVRTDGAVRTVEVNATSITRDGRPATMAVLRDVTERARVAAAQRLLAEASTILGSSLEYEETLASVARMATPTLADWCVIDLAEVTGHATPRLRRVAAAHADPARQDLMRQLWERYPVLEPDTQHTARRVFATGQVWFDPTVSRERLAVESRDPEHHALVQALGFTGEMVIPLIARGQTLGTMTLVIGPGRQPYDQTDLATAEELARLCATAIDNARLYAQARRAVLARDEFLGVAAHDLRTPITSLRGYAQLVLRQLDRTGVLDPQHVRRALNEINHQTQRLSLLVARLLDVSRIEADKLALSPEPVDLPALIDQAVDVVRRSHPDRTIAVRAPASMLTRVDPLRFEQVLVNLLDNAVKFSAESTSVEVTLAADADGTVNLEVRDHGVGVPVAMRDGLFERFHQAHGEGHKGGMGLGLYICRQIVERHGGQIRAEFPADGGTRMVVRLPAGPTTPPGPTTAADP